MSNSGSEGWQDCGGFEKVVEKYSSVTDKATRGCIKDLFPAPSLPPSRLCPTHWPGISHESTQALRTSLKDNHKFHVFFDPRGFHNHVTHYLLALWAMGADAEIINAAYKHESAMQKLDYESPEAITAENFRDHLGDEKYYNAYLKFFTEAVRDKDLWEILEEYVFDEKANFDESGEKQPEMLNRFLDGLLHPMIHVGYGCEFGLPGMIVEGLASTAVHKASASPLIPRSLWASTPVSALESLTSRLPSALSLASSTPASAAKNVHAFTILARILKDPEFDAVSQRHDISIFTNVVETHNEALNKHVNAWTYNRSDPKEVERKIEELVWANAIIYGIGGWTKGGDFNTDFFQMHLVTSSLFLTSIAAKLKPASQEIFLRSYFVSSLVWWIGRGRPAFDIAGFFADDTAFPDPHGPFPTPHAKSLPSPASPKATTPNPWLAIIQQTLVIPDDHLPKLQRALAHYGSLYGARAACQPDFADTELPGAEKLDGTLFIRTAGLTNRRLLPGKDLNLEAAGFWDRKGFYKA
ncbi:putative protein of unknown function (DUF4243) [Lyophyllum shimeji]|uniref:Oxidoreductase AflY n=1 Tax=Lyophyllum shimeji TaxID=47721 RepID=A0A9P3URR1_LYOSH|nr:putative protein of unknown function (DUF4243) [Lyophyllum shimeji]